MHQPCRTGIASPNQPAAPNPARALRFHTGRRWRRVGEPGRWAAVRTALSIALLFLCGCDFSPPANPFSREVTDKSGTNLLALIYVSTGPGPGPNMERFDFH